MTENGLPPELAAALVDFQASAPRIGKTRTALIPTKSGGSYSYKYADLSDIWDAIREPLKVCRLAVTQSLSGGSSGWLSIRTTVLHQSGQCLADTVEIEVGHRTPQEVGSQITYFKRYALSAVLGLVTEDDDDGAAASRRREPPEPEPAVDPVLLAEVEAADEARTVLAEATADYGWTWDNLVGEYWKRFSKNLKNTRDVDKINEFTEVLLAEAKDGKPLAHEQAAQTKPTTAPQKARPVTPAQSKQLHVLFKLNKMFERADYLLWCSEALGIPIQTTADLTFAQADSLIDKQKQLEKQAPKPEQQEIPPTKEISSDDNNGEG